MIKIYTCKTGTEIEGFGFSADSDFVVSTKLGKSRKQNLMYATVSILGAAPSPGPN
jgi:hypothetical protein